MIYNLKKYRAINKFLTIDWNSNRYYNGIYYWLIISAIRSKR